MLNFILAILLSGCAKPTEYDFCLQFQEEMCACDPAKCWDLKCEWLDVQAHCDPEAPTWTAEGCETAHRLSQLRPWECYAGAMESCDLETLAACDQ